MEIAPGIRVSEWIALNLNDDNSPDWDRAIEIFSTRIEGRYIKPADMLVAAEAEQAAIDRNFGFTVLAIDCLLIETLQAFREGLVDTRRKGERTIKNFLTQRPLFAEYFDDALAGRFYDEYRCGILHQAEIKNDSLVWSEGELVFLWKGKMIINRNEFHSRLKTELNRYLEALQRNSEKDLRRNFRKKMDVICRIEHFGDGEQPA